MPSLIDRMKERKARQAAESTPLFGMKDRGLEAMRNEVSKFKQEMMGEMRQMMMELLQQQGITTVEGKQGHTPQRGIDYLTPEEVAQIKAELKPKDGRDGKDADETFVISEVMRKMPKHDMKGMEQKMKMMEKMMTKMEIDPKKIARLLESLKGNDRLGYWALRDTPTKEFEGIKTVHRGGQGLAVFAQDLSAQCNGSTRSFTVPTHTRAIALSSSSFPNTYRLTTDYTTSGTVLTIDSALNAPAEGETLIFVYAQ